MNVHRTAKLEVWYDSWCPLCQQIHKRLLKLDWFKSLQFVSIRAPELVATLEKYGVSMEQVEKELHVRWIASNSIQSGIHAVISITKVVPPLWPLYPVLALLARMGVGEKLYNWIAGGRMIIPVGHCTDGLCPLNKK
ncbi:thiol-disulfide oxidoreductase DCC family protein [Paenibacillus agilis]|uniref:DUF393 domain-containing protein n=1 Tax=Paenibacillus agilis TaxID=3020863 RepID=A0A559IZX9_9BACL|nr:DUF393 domain-containing protein [Paenibacillus agilis]TVX93171.1 DUF393 domain-containing protein [Paenibacillus agilis]